ncbi:MAG: chemotaxis protein CheW [Gemmatimonadaceae bacterium]
MTSTASIETTPNAAVDHLLIVEVKGQLYGLDATHLREVVPALGMTRIPGAPSAITGLINLRGSLVVVADLGARLAGEEVSSESGCVVLVDVEGRSVGLAVNDVRDVVALPTEPIGAAATTIPDAAAAATLSRAVGRLDDAIVIVLDVPALVRQVVV